MYVHPESITHIQKQILKEGGLKKIRHVKINQKKSEVLIPVLKGKFQNNECYQS